MTLQCQHALLAFHDWSSVGHDAAAHLSESSNLFSTTCSSCSFDFARSRHAVVISCKCGISDVDGGCSPEKSACRSAFCRRCISGIADGARERVRATLGVDGTSTVPRVQKELRDSFYRCKPLANFQNCLFVQEHVFYVQQDPLEGDGACAICGAVFGKSYDLQLNDGVAVTCTVCGHSACIVCLTTACSDQEMKNKARARYREAVGAPSISFAGFSVGQAQLGPHRQPQALGVSNPPVLHSCEDKVVPEATFSPEAEAEKEAVREAVRRADREHFRRQTILRDQAEAEAIDRAAHHCIRGCICAQM